MIELIVKQFLDNHLDIPCFFEHPEHPLNRYVKIEKTSGGKTNYLKSSTFAFQSYANSLYEAAKLNEQTKEIVERLVECNEISGVSLNADYNYTDTETKQYRYQAVFDINHY